MWHSRLLVLLFLTISLGTISRKAYGIPEECLRPVAAGSTFENSTDPRRTSEEGTAITKIAKGLL